MTINNFEILGCLRMDLDMVYKRRFCSIGSNIEFLKNEVNNSVDNSVDNSIDKSFDFSRQRERGRESVRLSSEIDIG